MPSHLIDLLPVIVLALLIFGPKRLPEMGSSIGKTIKEFQKSMKEVQEPTPPAQITPMTAPQISETITPAAPQQIAAPAQTPTAAQATTAPEVPVE